MSSLCGWLGVVCLRGWDLPMIRLLWKFAVNAAALYVIGWVLVPSLPHDYLTIAEIAALLAIVNFFF